MANVAMWLIEDGDYESAEPLLHDTVKLRRKLLGDEHTDVASSLTILASLLIETGRFEEARTAAAEARAICLVALAKDHWRTAGATSAEGAALAGLSQYEAAESLLLEGFTVLNNDTGALPFFATNATRWLADFYKDQGDMEQAAKYRAMLGDSGSR